MNSSPEALRTFFENPTGYLQVEFDAGVVRIVLAPYGEDSGELQLSHEDARTLGNFLLKIAEEGEQASQLS